MEITELCNLKCSFCSRICSSKSNRSMPVDRAKELLERFYEDGNRKAVFTGGEPLLYPKIDELVGFAHDLGFDVAIQTNGILATKSLTRKLAESGLDQMVFSIHSHMPVMVDRIMGGKGVLERQLAGLENAHEAGLFAPISTVITRQNYRILPELFDFFIREYPFLKHFSMNFVDPVGRAAENSWIVPTLTESQLRIVKALLTLKRANKTFRIERVPICMILEFAEYNTELRRLVVRETSAIFRGRDFVSYTDEYFDEEYTRGKACDACFIKEICPGVDVHYAQIHGTDELFPVFIEPEVVSKKAGAD